MIKNRTIIEVEVKGRTFRLECASESSLQDVSEAVELFNNFVTERKNAIEAMQKAQETTQEPCVEKKE